MSESSIGELLDVYTDSKNKIFKRFGCDEVWLNIDDFTDKFWDLGEGEVLFVDTKEDLTNGILYSDEMRKSYESDDFVLICIINDQGESEALIFDKNKKIEIED